MIILLSPAKTIDMKKQDKLVHFTQCRMLERTEILSDILKGLTPSRLSELMDIKSALARKTAEYYLNFEMPFNEENAKQAILAFSGEVYRGLQAKSFTQQEFKFAQKSIRILSGLYGVIRPFDLIMPYRLEMSTPLVNPAGKNLYLFWREIITNCIIDDLEQSKSQALINLASEEYFKVIDVSKITKPIITPTFLEYNEGNPKIISVYAKKARGFMSAFIVKNSITNPEELKLFSKERYSFSNEFSDGNTWAFIR